ncbi:MAG: ABC transporter substrate-binding protein [Acidobacteria bacterium]|nr:ABC transporter substrate-binding protein [Acidobacteriota bacterium]
MRKRTPHIKLALVAMACIAALLVVSNRGVGAQQASAGLSPEEKRGKQIYLKGEDAAGRGEIKAVLGGDGLELPATSFTCANCHGLRGEGKQEGGLQPPAVNWETLASKHVSALTRRERASYAEATLSRAIRTGLDSAGSPLHPGMPRYEMSAEQLSDLVAYLKKIGKDVDTEAGVTETTLKVGAALPLSGPLARVGEDVRAALVAYFAEVNSGGGIYGRRFELVVEDSVGDPAKTVEATRKLVEVDGVFALVGSFEPRASGPANEYISQREVPLVGPTTLSPRLALPPNRYVFYLLPTFSDQARSLADYVAAKTTATKQQARLAVLYTASEFDADALAGLRAQARLRSLPVVAEQPYEPAKFSAADVVRELAAKKATHVFFFGSAENFTALARAMEAAHLDAALLSSIVMVGRGAFDLPSAVAARTYLAYPAALPNAEDFAEFSSVMGKAGVGMRSPAFQAVAFAAAKTLVEATKLCGRQLDRTSLIGALESLRDFRTGVVPPLTFGPNRRVGAIGSFVVGINLDKKEYTPLGEWLVPSDRP